MKYKYTLEFWGDYNDESPTEMISKLLQRHIYRIKKTHKRNLAGIETDDSEAGNKGELTYNDKNNLVHYKFDIKE